MKTLLACFVLLLGIAFAQFNLDPFEGFGDEAKSTINAVISEMDIILVTCPEEFEGARGDNPGVCATYHLANQPEYFTRTWSRYFDEYKPEGWEAFNPWMSDGSLYYRTYASQQADAAINVLFESSGFVFIMYMPDISKTE